MKPLRHHCLVNWWGRSWQEVTAKGDKLSWEDDQLSSSLSECDCKLHNRINLPSVTIPVPSISCSICSPKAIQVYKQNNELEISLSHKTALSENPCWHSTSATRANMHHCLYISQLSPILIIHYSCLLIEAKGVRKVMGFLLHYVIKTYKKNEAHCK